MLMVNDVLNSKLVDKVVYYDEVLIKFKELIGKKEEDKIFI